MRRNSFLYQCSPGIIIFTSLLIAIVIGTFFLSLPVMHHKPIPLIDLLFTTTSALCATGFFTISLDQFTLFGQTILLMLIQIGGLGLITLTLFFVYQPT
jgi:trk system potassium uptake protein TrkH